MFLPGRCFPAIALFVALCLSTAMAMADTAPFPSATGLRIGTSLMGEDIEQYDLFFARNLPWTKPLKSGWQLESVGELTATALHNDQEDGFSGSVAADLFLVSPERRFSFHSGIGTGLLADSTLGDYDFGGPIFFLFHAGASLQLTPRLSLGCRYAHQSNGHIYTKNPSLNLLQLELRFSF